MQISSARLQGGAELWCAAVWFAFVSGRDLCGAVSSDGAGRAPKLGSLIITELSEDTFPTYSSP